MPEYSSQTVPQLKELLKAKGLSVDGKKADLVARLTESDGQAEPAPEPAAEEAPETEPPQPETAEPEVKPTEPETSEKSEEKPEKPKPLTPEERKKLAVDLITKKIQRAEKFGDEQAAEAARKDLNRVEKFGVEPGTALAKEIGLVDKSFNNGLRERLFKKKFKHKKNFKPRK